ncbi:bifunctional P-loop containing nucleoside triphosphate hydrolase/Helicase [Babesia duncani]|uniref:Bifunctional P-loop containing nucleoside triphosphate hydrolase/Helicase n=1 Tax=Babesia duncani TaxID=323732 RepID=A0AAD9PKB0_9APIC|nr:bifunctional P-loop containing nucleoside triphosphate hydrolase/Helicase [Babesia duncani]
MDSKVIPEECSFRKLCIDSRLLDALTHSKISQPNAIQHDTISRLQKGTSLILQSKAGTGKTLSICIYVLNNILVNLSKRKILYDAYCERNKFSNGINAIVYAVIVTPTRELAKQIFDILESLTVNIIEIKSFLSIGGNEVLNDFIELQLSDPNIIVSTPGKLRTIFKQMKRKPNRKNLCAVHPEKMFQALSMLAFDEVDMLIEEQFIQQTRHICSRLVKPTVQVIATSATFIKPQFKQFQDIIVECDKAYIEDSVPKICLCKTIDDVRNALPEYFLHCWHCRNTNSECLNMEYINEEISNSWSINDIKEKLCNYSRNLEKKIWSTSHVNRFDLQTLQLLGNYIPNDSVNSMDSGLVYEGIVSDVSKLSLDASTVTPVLSNMKFFSARVLDAPTIVQQIHLKMQCIITVLSYVKYERCIIFCNQGHTRMQTMDILTRLKFPCCLTSSRNSSQFRLDNLKKAESKDARIVICTDVISRGIDFKNVDLVINMDMPPNKESFLHRSGRAARFGTSGICLSIVMQSEIETYDYFMYSLNFESLDVLEMFPDGSLDRKDAIDKDSIWIYDPFSDASLSLHDKIISNINWENHGTCIKKFEKTKKKEEFLLATLRLPKRDPFKLPLIAFIIDDEAHYSSHNEFFELDLIDIKGHLILSICYRSRNPECCGPVYVYHINEHTRIDLIANEKVISYLEYKGEPPKPCLSQHMIISLNEPFEESQQWCKGILLTIPGSLYALNILYNIMKHLGDTLGHDHWADNVRREHVQLQHVPKINALHKTHTEDVLGSFNNLSKSNLALEYYDMISNDVAITTKLGTDNINSNDPFVQFKLAHISLWQSMIAVEK